jgi:tRNA(fMet)-specific endonuclease VapC
VKYLLDTNTVSFLMRGEPAVVGRLTAQPRTEVLLPQSVIAEIEFGIAGLPRSARRSKLRSVFDLMLADLTRAPWTDDVSRTFGQIKAGLERRGTPLEDLDIAVAAHAVALGATLVTDNLSDMERIPGLHLENWLRD